MEETKETNGKQDTRVADALKAKQSERHTRPSKTEVKEAMMKQDKDTYEKNLLIMEQILRHEKKVVGNAKFNEDEYVRKKGRMKIINPTYEWEADKEQEAIDEKRLQQVYEDTKEALTIELEKISVAKNSINEQQTRIVSRNPDLVKVVVDKKELEKKYNEATKKE